MESKIRRMGKGAMEQSSGQDGTVLPVTPQLRCLPAHSILDGGGSHKVSYLSDEVEAINDGLGGGVKFLIGTATGKLPVLTLYTTPTPPPPPHHRRPRAPQGQTPATNPH